MNIKTLAILLILFPVASYAANDTFLKIDDVVGESQDIDHLNEIDVLSWSWGASTSGRITCIQDLSLVKWTDRSSPTLLMGQVQGRVYNKAILTVRNSGDTPLEYIIIEFENVSVSSISMGGSGGEERLTETMSLDFESATYTYTPQNEDGSTGIAETAEIYPSSRCK